MDRNTHLICESIQEITLYAWPLIYGKNNDYDLDSRDVLEAFRNWGEEFESWWESHDEEWICSHDYLNEVEQFAAKKVREYLSRDYVVEVAKVFTLQVALRASSDEEARAQAISIAKKEPESSWEDMSKLYGADYTCNIVSKR